MIFRVYRVLVVFIFVFSQATMTASAASFEPGQNSPCSASSGATLSTLPTSIVDRTALNPAAKTQVSQIKLCLVKGEQIFIMPTIVVHYFVHQKSGTIRSKAVMLSEPIAAAEEARDIALTLRSGDVRHFPKTALITSQTADDYEIYILRPGVTTPSYLASSQANYIVK